MTRGRDHKKTQRSKEIRRQEALQRQEIYDKLSIEEKIAKLDVGGFRAIKQRKKLGNDN